MARPCTSIGWPCSVVSVSEKPSPRLRRFSTACSMAKALPASSQLPKASTRWGAATPTMPGSPSMWGSSDPAGQSTITCGSENNSALARSRSLRSVAISSREDVSSRVQRTRARTSMIAVTTVNSTRPSTTTSTATSCRSMLSWALTTSSCSARTGLLLGAGGEGEDGAENGGQESASPRMRAATADPDRVRHAPSPLLAATTAHCQRIIAGKSPANRSTLLSSGIAPKESRS